MSIFNESQAVMKQIVDECKGMPNGVYPKLDTVNHLEAQLVSLYYAVGEQMATKFNAKESANLRRRIKTGQSFMELRRDKEIKKAVKDCETESLVLATAELYEEIDAATEYEQHVILRSSLKNAFDYLRSLASQLKN